MAAVVAALDMLAAENGAALTRAHDVGRALMTGIEEIGRAAGKDIHLRGVPPAFFVSFNDTMQITDYRTSLARDREAYTRFWLALQDCGVRTIPDGLWFVSTAHTEQDAARTLDAVREAIKVV